MKLYQFVLAGLLLFCGIVAAAGPQNKLDLSGQKSVYDELEKAPDKYRRATNPFANDRDAASAGGFLFEEHCEECHGKEAMGGRKAPSLRVEVVQNAAPGALFWILTNGVVRKRMPVWSKLPEPERWQLVSYIKSLGAVSAGGSQPTKP